MNLSGPLYCLEHKGSFGTSTYPQEIDIKNPNIRDLFESKNCLYLPNKDHMNISHLHMSIIIY